MIHCLELNKDFETKEDMFDALVENKSSLIAQKKSIKKEVDCLMITPYEIISDTTEKAEPIDPSGLSEIKVVAIINTSNILDSHGDVHIPNLWNKSLKENKMIMHVQEHKSREFDKIIADGDNLKASAKNFTWEELGYDFEGKTQALVFESVVEKKRNEFMFNQYANGYVKNHSVGMRYVQLVMCINDDNYGAEFEAWEKYYPKIVNNELADEKGYFWAVKEAKVIEGSAVPLGSNFVTPTQSVTALKNYQPSKDTGIEIEPPKGTHKEIDYKYLSQNLKLT